MEINFQRIYTTVRFFVEKKNIIIILQVKNSEEEHLFKMENFCDIINILTVTSDQFNTLLYLILLIITWKYLVFVVQTLIYELFFFFAIVVKNYSNDSHQNAKCKKNAYMLLTDFCDALSYCISDGLMAGGLADARRRLAQGQAGNGPAFLIAPNRMSACKLLT